MDKEQIRQIIREELKDFILIDKYTFQKHIQLFNGRNIRVGKSVGTQIGTEGGNNGQKIGLWGKTPTTQPETVSDPSGGGNIDTEARVAIIALIDRLQSIGILQT